MGDSSGAIVRREDGVGVPPVRLHLFCSVCGTQHVDEGEDAGPAHPHTMHQRTSALDWIIVGGESGPGARPFEVAWARSVLAQCKAAGVACFVKQLGAWVRGNHLEFGEGVVHRWMKSSACRSASVERQLGGGFQLCDPKGGSMYEWPEDLRVREYPRSQHAEAAQ